jgi:hypothetical protein
MKQPLTANISASENVNTIENSILSNDNVMKRNIYLELELPNITCMAAKAQQKMFANKALDN